MSLALCYLKLFKRPQKCRKEVLIKWAAATYCKEIWSNLAFLNLFFFFFYLKKKKILYGPFLWMARASCLKARATSRRQFVFLPLSSQKFLALILSTSKGWKARSTLEPPSGLENRTLGLGISALTTRPLLHKNDMP